jgi:hypothetical protein
MSLTRAQLLLGLAAAAVLVVWLSAAAPSRSAAQPTAGTWRIVSSPSVPGGELMGVAALSGSDVWAVGSRSVNGVFSPLAEHWNGSSWSSVPISAPGSFNELLSVSGSSSSDVWGVGVSSNWSGLLEHWNGSSWKVVASPIAGAQTPIYSVRAFAGNDVWAAGAAGGHGTLLHYNGSSWSVVSHPEPAGSTYTVFEKLAGTSPSDVWVAGSSQTSSQQTLVEHYDGSSWKIVRSAVQGSYNTVRGLVARTTGDAWLVGDWEDPAPSYTDHPLIQHWNGSSWSAVSSQVGELWGVVALSATDAWTVGNRPSGSGYTSLIEQWSGSSWNVVTPPSAGTGNNELNGVAAAGATLWAVGSYTPSGATQPLIETNPGG